MASILSIIPDVLKGALFIIFIFFVLYGLWRLIKMILPKPKPTTEVYDEVAEHITAGEPFSKFMEKISKYKWKKQQKYLTAYTELIKLNENERRE